MKKKPTYKELEKLVDDLVIERHKLNDEINQLRLKLQSQFCQQMEAKTKLINSIGQSFSTLSNAVGAIVNIK